MNGMSITELLFMGVKYLAPKVTRNPNRMSCVSSWETLWERKRADVDVKTTCPMYEDELQP